MTLAFKNATSQMIQKGSTEHGAELFCQENDGAQTETLDIRLVTYVVKGHDHTALVWEITGSSNVNISAGSNKTF
jgi:hypothetical protein